MRFFLPPPHWPDPDTPLAHLDPAESRHAAAVMRVRPGTTVTVFDGAGRVAEACVIDTNKKHVGLRLSTTAVLPPPAVRLTLAVAVPKGSTIEWIIEKAVELGATEILPLLTDRTVVRLTPDERTERRRKWERVAIEAAKQCGQNWLPRIHAPQPLDTALATAPPNEFQFPLLASLQPDALPLPDALAPRSAPTRTAHAALWIGPEGDFTPDEYSRLRAAGLLPVSLCPITLRVETAALFALSILRFTSL